MEIQSLERLMLDHPFVQELEPEYRQLLVGCASNVRLKAGEYLVREGLEANATFLILAGQVGIVCYVSGRGAFQIGTVGAGKIIGWSWLLAPYRWHFDAKAIEDVHAIKLDGTCLRQKCDADPKFGYTLTKRLLYVAEQRLEHVRMQLVDVFTPH